MAEECEPCLLGVSIETAKHLCDITTEGNDRAECNRLYEEVVLGRIDTKHYLSEIRKKISSDPDADKTMSEIQKIVEEKKL